MTGKLVDVLRRLIAEALDPTRYHPLTKYRVVSMQGERVNLQIVRKAPGLPDLIMIPQAGMAGAWSKLAVPGAYAFVAFVEGDPAQPVIIACSGTKPIDTTIDASGDVKIGASAASVQLASGSDAGVINPVGRVIRFGDTVNVPGVGDVILGPPAVPVSVSKVRA